MDDKRFSKLENRVDEIKDDVSELKAETKVQHGMIQDLKDDFKDHISVIKSHIAGDDKIINKIEPIIPQIKDIREVIEDYKYKKKSKEDKIKFLKSLSIKIGIVAATLGCIYTIVRIVEI